MIDAAQYGMLAIMWTGLDTESIPSSQFLQQLCKSCRLQLDSDRSHGVPWSRHLLTNIQQATGASLLIGASAVTYNPHFLHYASPFSDDTTLGAVSEWPMVPALLLLDSFAPSQRAQVLQKAALHLPGVWVLRQHKGRLGPPDLTCLQHHGATLIAELPKNSEVLHETRCWVEAAWDARPSRHVTQLWHLSKPAESDWRPDVPRPETVRHRMEGRGHYRFSFHWCEDAVPARLQYYRQHQQDALRYSWDGVIAGTDGSVDERTESMGAGYVVGVDPTPDMTLSIRVGGPLSTTRAEAASLLRLVRDVGSTSTCRICLLVFVDCMVVLEILSKWGRWDYHPRPKEIVHFDVISQLLVELRKWPGSVKLVKVKSHSGCLLNERADEEAERGRAAEGPELCQGPQKYGALWIRIRPSTRAACGQPLPRDSAPNVSIIKKVVAANILRAVQKRNTVFVRDLFHRQDGSTVSSVIRRCQPAEYRIWLRCMMGIYPTQTYLHRVGLAASQLCPFCSSAVPETLAHFACVCPQFREARTSAHNQVRRVVTSFLTPLLQSHWTAYEETQMQHTGLTLHLIPAARVAEALGQDPDPTADPDAVKDLGRWQPDWVFVSAAKKRIALVDLCRPADDHPQQLVAAGIRKQQRYGPLVEALSHYSDNGWLIHVFPWVVGIRGMIDPRLIGALLGFLNVPQKHWRPAVERTALASVQALHFLHRVRFGGSSEDRRPGLSRQSGDGSDGECDDTEVLEQATLKRKKNNPVDGSKTSSEDDFAAASRKRRMHIHLSMTLHQSHTPARIASRRTQLPDTRRVSTQTSKSSRVRQHKATGRPSSQCKWTDPGAYNLVHSAERKDRACAHRKEDCQPNCQQRESTLCKRKLSNSANRMYDTDDPDERNRKQPRHSNGTQLDMLWSRWRQLADQRRR
jgi:ribonuclease HI